MRSVSVAEARSSLPALLDAIQRGESFLITRHGQPIAEMRPATQADADRRPQEPAICVVAGMGVLALTAPAVYDAVAQMRRHLPTVRIAESDGTRSTIALSAIDHLKIVDGSAEQLTRREIQVLQLIAEGLSNRAIAEALALSERTVENHIANVFTKANVRSRGEAARLFADSEGSAASAGFRVTTLMGYSYDSRGKEQLSLLANAIDVHSDTVHELKIPGGRVFIPTDSIAALATYSAGEFDERLPVNR